MEAVRSDSFESTAQTVLTFLHLCLPTSPSSETITDPNGLTAFIQASSYYKGYDTPEFRSDVFRSLDPQYINDGIRLGLINNIFQPVGCPGYNDQLINRRSLYDEQVEQLGGKERVRRSGGSEPFVGETMIFAGTVRCDSHDPFFKTRGLTNATDDSSVLLASWKPTDSYYRSQSTPHYSF